MASVAPTLVPMLANNSTYQVSPKKTCKMRKKYLLTGIFQRNDSMLTFSINKKYQNWLKYIKPNPSVVLNQANSLLFLVSFTFLRVCKNSWSTQILQIVDKIISTWFAFSPIILLLLVFIICVTFTPARGFSIAWI